MLLLLWAGLLAASSPSAARASAAKMVVARCSCGSRSLFECMWLVLMIV
jgi:hypothetical protein